MNPGACVNPGQPPSAEADRQQIRGEPEPIPGQLTLPGMPSPAEAVAGQATLPGLEFPAADGRVADGPTADDRAADDGDLAAVAAELRALDGDGSRMAAAIRGALDMLLDGQHTGRYRWDQLHKTEKTHAGTLVEIALARALRLADGTTLDYTIAGAEVDCKFSHRLGGWMIPPEADGKLMLRSRPATRTAPGRPGCSAPPGRTFVRPATGTASAPWATAAARRCAGCTPAPRCRRTR